MQFKDIYVHEAARNDSYIIYTRTYVDIYEGAHYNDSRVTREISSSRLDTN